MSLRPKLFWHLRPQVLKKFVIAQTVFVTIVDEILHEKIPAGTRVSVRQGEIIQSSINHRFDSKKYFSPDDLNGRIVRLFFIEAINKLVKRFVRRRLELWDVVAQVGNLVHRVFTFKRRTEEKINKLLHKQSIMRAWQGMEKQKTHRTHSLWCWDCCLSRRK